MFEIRLLILPLVFVLLAGCQNVAKVETPSNAADSWQVDTSFFASKLKALKSVNSWQMSGKIGIVAPQINQSANIHWDRRADTSSLKLYGPLGVGAVEISYDNESARLADSKGNERKGETPEQLLFETLGWQVPFNALQYWLMAVPDPEYLYEYKLSPETQLLSELRQRGWHLYFSKYSLNRSGKKMRPRKVRAKNKLWVDGEEVEVTIRIIVRSLVETEASRD